MLMVFSQRTRLQHHTFTKEIKMLASLVSLIYLKVEFRNHYKNGEKSEKP